MCLAIDDGSYHPVLMKKQSFLHEQNTCVWIEMYNFFRQRRTVSMGPKSSSSASVDNTNHDWTPETIIETKQTCRSVRSSFLRSEQVCLVGVRLGCGEKSTGCGLSQR